MSSHIRIEEAGDVAGRMTRVIFVAKDGTETDISEVTTAVSYSGKVGELNRATVELIKVHGSIRSPLVDVVVRDMKVRRWRRWTRRYLHRDVTTLGKKTREYISA